MSKWFRAEVIPANSGFGGHLGASTPSIETTRKEGHSVFYADTLILPARVRIYIYVWTRPMGNCPSGDGSVACITPNFVLFDRPCSRSTFCCLFDFIPGSAL